MSSAKSNTQSEPKAPTLLPNSQALNLTLTRVGQASLHAGNKIKILLNGKETYDEWLKQIANAKNWIHLENYIIQNDKIGNEFAEALITKAKEGVKVRVIYDWFGCFTTPKSYWNKLRKNGVDVRVISPFRILSPLKVLQRDHRKYLGIDGVYASTGGVCIGDQWLEHSPVTKLPYRDTAVNIQGPAIVDLENAFAKLWNTLGQNLSNEEVLSNLSFPSIQGDDAVRIISQEPGKMRILRIIELMISGAQKRIWIADAYFLAIPSLYQALINAAKDGVDVRILLPSTNDIPWIAALSRTGYRQLLSSGIRIWEYSGLMMHSKTTLVDSWWSRIGSTNLNISSFLLNWELDLIVEDRDFASQMERIYEEDLKNAKEVCLDKEHRRRLIELKPMSFQDIQIQERIKRKRLGGSKLASTAVRVGSFAVKYSGSALVMHEKKVSGFLSFIGLFFGLLFFFFPKVFAWPVAFVLIIASLIGFARLFEKSKLKNEKKPS